MNRTRLIATLSLCMFFLFGCGHDPSDQGKSANPLTPSTSSPVALDQDCDELLNSLEYETISGTLTPGFGGAMGMNLVTWGRNCWFGVVVPPEAMAPGGDPIEFTMRIPTKSSYLLHPEILNDEITVRLEPDGMHFLAPIRVYTTWMPWLPFSEGGGARGFCVGEEEADSTFTPEWLPDIKRWRQVFQVHHFSDWRVGPEVKD
jgi:hypothetical protein